MKQRLNKRKCKNCKEEFMQERPLQYLCNNNKCVYEYTEKKLQEKAKKEQYEKHKEYKENTKKLQEYEEEAKTSFQYFIRLRDSGQPCISCGNWNPKDWAGGHYYPAGQYSGLIFDERNCHAQCNSYCNMHLRGNLHAYRKGLVQRYGEDFVKELEEDSNKKRDYKYTKNELIAKKLQYDLKIKELKKNL